MTKFEICQEKEYIDGWFRGNCWSFCSIRKPRGTEIKILAELTRRRKFSFGNKRIGCLILQKGKQQQKLYLHRRSRRSKSRQNSKTRLLSQYVNFLNRTVRTKQNWKSKGSPNWGQRSNHSEEDQATESVHYHFATDGGDQVDLEFGGGPWRLRKRWSDVVMATVNKLKILWGFLRLWFAYSSQRKSELPG